MMQKMYWLNTHIGTIEDAKSLAEEFTWRITVTRHEDQWYVFDSEAKIFSSTHKENVDAFLYGLALAYAVIPEPFHTQLKKDITKWLEDL